MNFLIIAENYYPLPLANSICIKNIVEELESIGHHCLVINRTDAITNIENSDRIHNFHYIKVPLYGCIRRFVYKIGQLFVYPHVNKKLVLAYYKQIKNLDLSNVDVIVSICNPLEGVLAAISIKREYARIKQVIYNVDTLSDFRIQRIESICCPFWRKFAYRVEKKIFTQADLIVFFKSHRAFYSKSRYVEFKDKFLFQDVPLLSLSGNPVSKDNGHCIYAGRFYRDFREPSVLLKIFIDTGMPLDIYTTLGFHEIIINEVGSSNNICVYEYIPEDILYDKMKQSRILMSIGNKSSSMFPSKIVTYLSMCKPIIHLFFDDMDPVIEYLKNYPDVLFVDLRDSIAKNRALVSNFYTKEHPQIDIAEIKSRYETSMPQFCAKEIIDCIS